MKIAIIYQKPFEVTGENGYTVDYLPIEQQEFLTNSLSQYPFCGISEILYYDWEICSYPFNEVSKGSFEELDAASLDGTSVIPYNMEKAVIKAYKNDVRIVIVKYFSEDDIVKNWIEGKFLRTAANLQQRKPTSEMIFIFDRIFYETIKESGLSNVLCLASEDKNRYEQQYLPSNINERLGSVDNDVYRLLTCIGIANAIILGCEFNGFDSLLKFDIFGLVISPYLKVDNRIIENPKFNVVGRDLPIYPSFTHKI